MKRVRSQAITLLDSQIKARLNFGAAYVLIIPKHLYNTDDKHTWLFHVKPYTVQTYCKTPNMLSSNVILSWEPQSTLHLN